MGALQIVLDPVSEDPLNTPLTLTAADQSIVVTEWDVAAPDLRLQTAQALEGELVAARSHGPRRLTVTVLMRGSTQSVVQSVIASLQSKVAKIARGGGTMQVTTPAGSVGVFDLEAADRFEPALDVLWQSRNAARATVGFVARPYIRGTESQVTLTATQASPVRIMTSTAVPGDVPALGRLVLSDTSGVNQGFALWALEANYDTATTAGPYYQAANLTALGSSTKGTGPSGATGTVITQGTLLPTEQAVLSTQHSGTGAHLTHTGQWQIWCRINSPASNTGDVRIGWQWAVGDFRSPATNQRVSVPNDGAWRLVNLGTVTIPQTGQTGWWEGRLIVSSTANGDDIHADWLLLAAVDDAYGAAAAIPDIATPTTIAARDEFTGTTAGQALDGRAAPLGGTWATNGVGGLFGMSDGPRSGDETVVRADDGQRQAVLGTTSHTAVRASVDFWLTGGSAEVQSGLIVRWVDSSNYAALLLVAAWGTDPIYPLQGVELRFVTVISGMPTVVHTVPFPWGGDIWYTLVASVLTDGSFYGRVVRDRATVAAASTYSPLLATGGALAAGRVGFVDRKVNIGAPFSYQDRFFDNFSVSVPVTDAAVFANRSLEVRHDRAMRQDPTGTVWQPVSDYSGDYLRVPPGSPLRVTAKSSRLPPATGGDPAADSISAALYVTPRYLTLPG